MKTLNDYFDIAKRKTGSDRQTAIRMGIAANRISMARKDGYMSNEFCVKLAQVAGVEPMQVIAAAEIKKNPGKAEFWSRWDAASVVMCALLTGGILLPNQSHAETSSTNNIYIMRGCG